MPGMGMDPMQAMTQGMFGGLGGPGMGMSGMNTGMGFPAGQIWNGGFNGQSGPWMSGQDNFNQNGYGSHANGMGGDFGANAGYAGYNMSSNQGNYNQMNQHQFPNHDFQNNGYHGQGFPNRGRGRGRYHPYAPRGRGGFNQVTNGNYANHESFHNQPSQYPRRDGMYPQNPQQSQDEEKQEVDEFGRDISGMTQVKEVSDEEIARAMAPGDADENESPEGPATVGTQEAAAVPNANEELPKPSDESPAEAPAEAPASRQDTNPAGPDSDEQIKESHGPPGSQEHEKPAPIQTFISNERVLAEPTSPSSAVTAKTMMPPPTPVVPQAPRSSSFSSEKSYDYNARGRGSGRDYARGHSDLRGTGRGHASAYPPHEINTHVKPAPSPVAAPLEPKGVGVEGAPKGPKAMREGLANTGLRGGRGFSIVGRAASAAHGRPNGHIRSRSDSSASPDRSRSRSRSRSRTPARDHSHRHRSHRHRSPSPARETTDEERERRRERHERHKRRSRKHEDSEEEKDGHTTPAHHSSHRTRRDRSADRDEDPTSHHRSHRSRRDRERDGETRSARKRSHTPPAPTSEDTNGVQSTELPSSTSSSSRKRRDRERDIEDEDERAERDRKRSRRDYAEENNVTSRKDEDYEQARRDRKRSRRECAEESSSATATHAQHDKHSSSSRQPSQQQQKHSSSHKPHLSSSSSAIPKGPAAASTTSSSTKHPESKRDPPTIDPHELERQARNKERMQKELQRREAMEGKAPTGPRASGKHQNGGAASLGRRVSYKYEDDLGGHERVEREREAGRWG
ncbi:MAG: hypothetical protein Q9207_001866 [Kuettlingeria erythrocarpa]